MILVLKSAAMLVVEVLYLCSEPLPVPVEVPVVPVEVPVPVHSVPAQNDLAE